MVEALPARLPRELPDLIADGGKQFTAEVMAALAIFGFCLEMRSPMRRVRGCVFIAFVALVLLYMVMGFLISRASQAGGIHVAGSVDFDIVGVIIFVVLLAIVVVQVLRLSFHNGPATTPLGASPVAPHEASERSLPPLDPLQVAPSEASDRSLPRSGTIELPQTETTRRLVRLRIARASQVYLYLRYPIGGLIVELLAIALLNGWGFLAMLLGILAFIGNGFGRTWTQILNAPTYLRTTGAIPTDSLRSLRGPGGMTWYYLWVDDHHVMVDSKVCETVRERQMSFGTVDYSRVGELVFGIYDAQGQVVYQFAGYERAEWTLS